MKKSDNCGCGEAMLENGYETLKVSKTGNTIRYRDNIVPNDAPLVETDNGGFLGRTESHQSQSYKD